MKSNSKEAKEIIRKEINHFYPNFKDMRVEAGAHSLPREHPSDYAKAKNLVAIGQMYFYPIDQAKMLSKIYDAEKVKKWDSEKVMNIYSHLIAREYAEMIREGL